MIKNLKKLYMFINFLLIVNSIEAVDLPSGWSWSSGKYAVDRYTNTTLASLSTPNCIAIYLVGESKKYFIKPTEAGKALLAEILVAKINGISFQYLYNSNAVEGDWFELGAIKY